jgi:aminotransferase
MTRSLKAAGKLARFSPVSSPTQRCLVGMLQDTQFLEKYIAENQKRLRDRFCKFREGLNPMGIKYIDESHGGVYCWVEMRNLMQSYSEKGELSLWKRLLSEAKVNVTPGSACHCIEPGWFRFCFATVRDPDMIEALSRI